MNSRVFIIVDALDDYQVYPVGTGLDSLSEIFTLQAKCGANVFTTSRFITESIKKFKESISLEIRANEEDVRRYLDGRMSQLPTFVGRSPDFQEEIKTETVK